MREQVKTNYLRRVNIVRTSSKETYGWYVKNCTAAAPKRED